MRETVSKMVTAGLQALEFTDCLLDSPDFRENLNKHEKELEKTSAQIKRIIKEVKDLLAAAKSMNSYLHFYIYTDWDEVSILFWMKFDLFWYSRGHVGGRIGWIRGEKDRMTTEILKNCGKVKK